MARRESRDVPARRESSVWRAQSCQALAACPASWGFDATAPIIHVPQTNAVIFLLPEVDDGKHALSAIGRWPSPGVRRGGGGRTIVESCRSESRAATVAGRSRRVARPSPV